MTQLQILAIGGPIWAAVLVGAIVLVSSYFDDRAMAREHAREAIHGPSDRMSAEAAPATALHVTAPVQRDELTDLRTRLRMLTPRERQVLDLIGSGVPNRQIAMKLNLSLATVKLHRTSVLRKMKAHSTISLLDMMKALDTNSAPATRSPARSTV